MIPIMLGFHWNKVVWAPAALQQHTTGITTTTTMAAAGRNVPRAPHMRPCAPCQLMGDNPPPPKQSDILFGVVEGVLYGPQSTPLFRQRCIATTFECFEGHTHPQHPQKLYLLAWVVVAHPFNASVWSAKPHMGRSGPFLLTAAMVGYDCVGHCWLMQANVRLTYCFFIPT